MAKLQLSQIVALTLAVESDPVKAGRAAAVVLAESGGDTAARCFNVRGADGRVRCGAANSGTVLSIDRGLWQINSKAHPTVTDAQADDPAAATRYAHRLSKGFVDFSPWVAYKTGAHRKFETLAVDEARAQKDTGVDVKLPGLPDVPNPLAAVGDLAGALGKRETWVRVAQVAGGVVAVVLGAVILNKDLVTQVGAAAATGGASAAAGAATKAAAAGAATAAAAV